MQMQSLQKDKGDYRTHFWKCHLYNDFRQPYLDKLDTLKRHCARDNYEAYPEISQNIELPCFKNCGIINGNGDTRKAHMALPQKDARLRTQT